MKLIFLAYANSQQEPLPILKEEDERVYKTLSFRMAQRHFHLHRDAHTTIPTISEYLTLFQEYIVLFHFAGHAGRDQLLLADEEANAVGIAASLGRCPNLKLALLNGCSTQAQVRALQKAGVPVIIATSAPVEDRSAAQFAITFFEAMADKHRSIRDAFADAVAAAQIQSAKPLHEKRVRGIIEDDARTDDQPLWGLYYQEDNDLNWTLPMDTLNIPLESPAPNELLIKYLLEALAPYDEVVRKIKEDEDQDIERGASEKRKAILACLPHPVSQQLRKLMSKEMNSGDRLLTFYDKPSPDRLRQIAHTYGTIVELLAFILLANLWEASENTANNTIRQADLSTLQEFLTSRNDRRKPFDFAQLIRTIHHIMERNQLPFFIQEFRPVSRQFHEDTPLAAACRFLEALRQRIASNEGRDELTEVARLCHIAEEKLAIVCAQLGFLAMYSLSSVHDIQVLKFRHESQAKFKHKIIRLAQEFIDLEERPSVLNNFMDTHAVLLQRKQDHTCGFLNLSPFVIDEGAFDKKDSLDRIFFFERYDKSSDAHHYRHVYKPSDPPLVVKQEKNFKVIYSQFDAFSLSLFNKMLKDL